jgi:hypothetical protein
VQVSSKELTALLTKPSLAGIPLLVLGNKNDLPGALGTQQLIERMGLQVRQLACSYHEGRLQLAAMTVVMLMLVTQKPFACMGLQLRASFA